jgi:hypothetical protein
LFFEGFEIEKESLMNWTTRMTHGNVAVTRSVNAASKRLLTAGALAFALIAPAIAQNTELQEKVAAIKQIAAANTQRLHQYQWTEVTQLTLKGDPKPASTNICHYGPDGQVQKTLVSPPPEAPSGGRLKQRIIAKKKEEMRDYMGDVKVLLSQYVPPDPQKMQQAYQAGKVTLNPVGGMVNLIFKDYSLPGDQMTITFDTAAHKIISMNVSSYLGEEKDAVTLQVQMASLPDGTNYTAQSVINATAKELVVTTTNSNYQKM